MKFNRKGKCTEINKSEYDDIIFIHTISSCIMDAVDKVMNYLIDYNINFSKYDYKDLSEIAFNLYSAVLNNYNYLKIK